MRFDGRYYRHRHGPPPFVRRMGCAFFMLMVLTAIAAGLLSKAPATWAIAIAAFVLVAVMVGFAFAIRRVARFFAEQDRLRRQLMADVAHELRTPLAILQGKVEGMLDGVYPRDEEQLGDLLAETQHLSRLVEDVRTLANAEAGALDLRKEKIDPAELIRDAAAAIAVPVTVDVPDELPPINVDPVRIREVLLNLLSNASEHAQGAISISAASRGRMLTIRVRDNGPGIPAAELPHVFDRFHKGRTSRGSGLGLSIARKLVVAHGGTIGVDSTAGEGTTVTVSLPLDSSFWSSEPVRSNRTRPLS
jgi:two-component system sensor histidine kinase BaeS